MDPVKVADQLVQADAFANLPPALQTALFMGALVLIPAAMVTLTAYTRIVIVLSFVRRAVTSQDIPPNLVLIGLALFLTLFVMSPTIDAIGTEAVTPFLEKKIDGVEAIKHGQAHLHKFMVRQTRRQDLALFLHLAGIENVAEPADTPMRALIPAFVISELKTAFVMGFCIFLPFLLVDLVVASVLTAMGMVLMPPIVVSTPIKIMLFVVADGWHLVVRALSLSFG